MSGLAKKMGVTAAIFTVAGLTSLGLPGLSGFVAELLVFIGIFQSYGIWGIILGSLAVIGAALTAIYILRLIAKVFLVLWILCGMIKKIQIIESDLLQVFWS
ncbi:MAG: hypothetical protein CM1200mP3_04070 [Chloroflexota bacterium]|nr:MAG: hypothetical protein CM1200mP3_04070 [Chloroflexota bacterium]